MDRPASRSAGNPSPPRLSHMRRFQPGSPPGFFLRPRRAPGLRAVRRLEPPTAGAFAQSGGENHWPRWARPNGTRAARQEQAGGWDGSELRDRGLARGGAGPARPAASRLGAPRTRGSAGHDLRGMLRHARERRPSIDPRGSAASPSRAGACFRPEVKTSCLGRAGVCVRGRGAARVRAASAGGRRPAAVLSRPSMTGRGRIDQRLAEDASGCPRADPFAGRPLPRGSGPPRRSR
jgi:hypothetical protein